MKVSFCSWLIMICCGSTIFAQSDYLSYPYILQPLSKESINDETKFFFDDFDGDGYKELIDFHTNIPGNYKVHIHKLKYPLVFRQINF